MNSAKHVLPRFLAFLLFCSLINAQQTTSSAGSGVVPRLVKFSGKAVDVQGKVVSGIAGATFAIYKEESGGSALWLETQNIQADAKGNYTVQLGATKADGLPLDLFSSGEARWLGVTVNGGQEQARVLLLSVPYALKAADAETLGGKPLSAFQMAVPQANSSSTQSPQAATEQLNEIVCSSGTACKAGFVPFFSSNGGSAKVSDSLISQSGSNVTIGGNGNIKGNESVSGSVSASVGNFSGKTNGPEVTITNAGSGDGLDVTVASANGNGLSVTNTASGGIGFLSTAAFPIIGHAPASGGQALLGVANADSDYAPAVYGIEWGPTKKTLGIEGFSASPNGAGVFGFDVINSFVGSALAGDAGVWGDNGQQNGTGVRGTVDDGFAMVGTNNSLNPTAFFVNTETTSNQGLVFETYGQNFNGGCDIDVMGNLFCSGSKSAVVPVNGGARKVALYAIEGPEHWFEDAGSARLVNGEAVVNLESVFGETVNTDMNYHVFLTPNGDCKGLYVTQKTARSFIVRELGGGTSNITFDFRIMAKRKGYESIRLADKTEVFSMKNLPMHRSQSPSGKMPDPAQIRRELEAHLPVMSVPRPAKGLPNNSR
jgi:hypothetical protein